MLAKLRGPGGRTLRRRIAIAAAAGVLVAVGVVTLARSPSRRMTTDEGSDAKPVPAGCDRVASSRSVRRLLRSLRPGEAGCLPEGAYTENVTIRRGGRRGSPIVLRAVPGERATIRGIFSVSRTAHDIVVEGLILDGANDNGTPSPQINGKRITFSGNRVTNHQSAICFVLGGGFARYGIAHDVRLLRNRIHDCGRLPATLHDHGVYIEGSVGAIVRGNLIYGNADWGVHLYPSAQNSLIEGNIIDGNGGGVIFAGEHGHASNGNVVTRNVIANSTRTYNIESYWGGPIGVRNVATQNCIWGGAEGNIAEQIGFVARNNIVAAPQYLDAPRNDLRLRPGSACALLLDHGAGVSEPR
jgi:parallel beta-helix repeat protein